MNEEKEEKLKEKLPDEIFGVEIEEFHQLQSAFCKGSMLATHIRMKLRELKKKTEKLEEGYTKLQRLTLMLFYRNDFSEMVDEMEESPSS